MHQVHNHPSPAGVLASLRQRMPHRPLSLSESLRIAELQANVLLELTGIDSTPIDIELLQSLPRIQLTTEPDLPVSGSALWTGGAWLITLNADEPETRRRYSAFHELKHIIDHPLVDTIYRGDGRITAEQQRERTADYFSACVLMPKRLVKRYWGEGHNRPDDLAAIFEVSEVAMRFRLDQLGLTEPRSRCDRPRSYRRALPRIRASRYERVLA